MIGSHNSFTYLPAKNIVGKLTSLFWRCQKLTLSEQLERGVRCFDVRIRRSKKGNWEFAHGLAVLTSASEFYNHFAELDKYHCYVRIVFEDSGKNREKFELYRSLCRFLEDAYLNITFFEGRVKGTWEKIYTFKFEPVETVVQPVASMSGDWYGKILPGLWDYMNHNKSRKNIDNKNITLLDFITKEETWK